jgi:hypothetical protein
MLAGKSLARDRSLGQKRPVHVFIPVTEGTIEEGILDTSLNALPSAPQSLHVRVRKDLPVLRDQGRPE